MRVCQSIRKSLGISLIESIIVMGIMVVVLGATHAFLASGVDFYTRSVQGLEVQQQTLVGLAKMIDDLENSSLDKIFVPPAPDNVGVVFPSPEDAAGQIGTNDKGILLWESIVCFSERKLSDGNMAIVKKVVPHPDPPGAVDYPPDPITVIGGPMDLAYFASRPATTIIARRVAVPAPGDPPAFQIVKGTDKLTISLKIEFSQRTRDSMRVEGQVFPRN